uniref:Secreted protein n=1 Tax=Nothoprocta perdicaria TaxID=30464 RepID=A0A8C7EH62_NOTPE
MLQHSFFLPADHVLLLCFSSNSCFSLCPNPCLFPAAFRASCAIFTKTCFFFFPYIGSQNPGRLCIHILTMETFIFLDEQKTHRSALNGID